MYNLISSNVIPNNKNLYSNLDFYASDRNEFCSQCFEKPLKHLA